MIRSPLLALILVVGVGGAVRAHDDWCDDDDSGYGDDYGDYGGYYGGSYPAYDYGYSNYGTYAPRSYGTYYAPSYATSNGYYVSSPAARVTVLDYSAEREIVIVNPPENATILNYQLNGAPQTILAGKVHQVQASSEDLLTITFDRSGQKGITSYSLSPGRYKFVGTQQGWELFKVVENRRGMTTRDIPGPPPNESP